ncbi:hypothetical protein D9M68_696780 [compost metagenome]
MLFQALFIDQLFVFRFQFLIFLYQLVQVSLLAGHAHRLLLGLVQHFIQFEVPLVGDLACPVDHVLRQSTTLCYRKGIRTTRFAQYQLVQR